MGLFYDIIMKQGYYDVLMNGEFYCSANNLTEAAKKVEDYLESKE